MPPRAAERPGRLADFKAAFLNAFIRGNSIASVIAFGCGDGNLLSLLSVTDFTGVAGSPGILDRCRSRFAGRGYRFVDFDGLADVQMAELALSLDVIYHLAEDDVFEKYMRDVFMFATNFVIVYSSNHDGDAEASQLRHRCVTDYVRRWFPDWSLLALVPNLYPFDPQSPEDTSFCDFLVFGRAGRACRLLIPAASG